MKPGILNLLEPSRPVHPCKRDCCYLYLYLTNEITKLSDILYAQFLALKTDFICYILLILTCPYACFHYKKSTILSRICQCFCTSHTSIFRRVRKIEKSDCYLRHACLSACPSVRSSAWNNMSPTGRIFIKFYILVFLEKLSKSRLEFITNLMHNFIYSIIMLHHDPQHISYIYSTWYRHTLYAAIQYTDSRSGVRS
jgi:hypothetical protein